MVKVKKIQKKSKAKERGYTEITEGCDHQVAINIENMLQTAPCFPPNPDGCIHKVPVHLRNVNEAAYTPQIISIGPLHRGDKKLQPMQDYKKSFLRTLLGRKPSIKLEDCVETLRGLEKQVRDSYFNQEYVRNISSNDFVEMMLLDGCFIVELLMISWSGNEKLREPYRSIIRFDLTLFENQLPYFLIEHLFDFFNDNNASSPVSFFDISANYFSCFIIEDKDAHRLKNSRHPVKHFLDLILNCQRPSGLISSDKDTHQLKNSCLQVIKHILGFILNCRMPTGLMPSSSRKFIYLPSATELHESGVEFKKLENHCYLDIKSNKNGVLEIPVLEVTDHTEHIFRNMIAMEQCQVSTTNAYITHYIILLVFLISTPKDVALLRRKRIINTYLGSDEAVAELINKLGTGVIADTMFSPYFAHINNMDAFYNRRRNKWKKILGAAFVLLICTIAQTVCSIISLF